MLAERAKTQNCVNKIMYKFNDKSLARCRYKQKKSPQKTRPRLHLYALLSHQTLSVIAPIFLKLVFGEALNLCAKFSKFLFLSASSLSSVSEI